MESGIIAVIVISIILIISVVLLITRIRIVRQTQKLIIERVGAYHATWSVGFHFLLPFVDKVAKIVSMKEQIIDFDPQPVITKDNVTMQIDTIVFYQITDPKLYAYGVENPTQALESLSSTTLRNIIGELDLDETLTSRDTVNAKMRSILDEATDPWGIKINRVELKNIKPPAEIQDAMEKQMKAERERREAILRAEGEKKSSILIAEGKKESQILEAEAQKQSTILRAEAEKEARIKKAEAEAAAILKINNAQAESIRLINEANPQEAYLTLKKLEAFEKASNGQATKLIIPSDLQGVAGLVGTISETAKTTKQ